MNHTMFEIRGLRFAYPDREPLFDGLALEVGSSGRVLIRGANGAGKSTLLRLLAGILTPQAGVCLISGNPSHKLTPSQYRSLLYRDQNSRANLFGLTPRHDLELWQLAAAASLDGCAPDTLEAGLGASLDTPYTQLSSGQIQACSLLLLPWLPDRFWLLDEPTAGLDERRKQELAQLVAQKRASGCGLIVVSHDPALPQELFDRVLILEHGTLREA